ncbi:HK97 family phage prohead protease [Comamonas sp. JC664]|uniref:HK97 family phage prohead protease n=1 Tax=Comamonas sp. JC664 TaxID=2801917 RepID=UPI00191FF7CB|nr:HK97 family phage prohead protease [Comamonas sp. JC664]
MLAIKAAGEEFRSPVLWNHDDWNPAIGVARCYREGDQWLMTPAFDGACEKSRTVAAKVKAGTLDQCSIRFNPLQEPIPNAEGGFDYPLVEVLEVSIVNIGANPDAVRLRSAKSGGSPSTPDGAEGGLLKQMARRMEHLQAQLKRLLKALGEDEEEASLDDPEKADPDDEDDDDPEKADPDDEDDDPEKADPDDEDDDDPEKADPDDEDDDDPEKADPDDEDDDDDDPEKADLDDEDDEPLSQLEAKVLRVRLVKRGGFTPAQAKALSHGDLRRMVALLCPA